MLSQCPCVCAHFWVWFSLGVIFFFFLAVSPILRPRVCLLLLKLDDRGHRGCFSVVLVCFGMQLWAAVLFQASRKSHCPLMARMCNNNPVIEKRVAGSGGIFSEVSRRHHLYQNWSPTPKPRKIFIKRESYLQAADIQLIQCFIICKAAPTTLSLTSLHKKLPPPFFHFMKILVHVSEMVNTLATKSDEPSWTPLPYQDPYSGRRKRATISHYKQPFDLLTLHCKCGYVCTHTHTNK